MALAAISNPKKVAPFANGDLIMVKTRNFILMDNAYLINVGVSPRTNAPTPSVLQTVRTQCRVLVYLRPVAAENPSVCIRDLIISIGYITAQSYVY